MTATVLGEIRRAQQLILVLNRDLLNLKEAIMQELEGLKADIQTLKNQAAEAKADAARHEQRTVAAVGLMQALVAKIGELEAQPAGASPAELAALRIDTMAAIAEFDAANVQRDAADATLEQGTVDATPQTPAP